MSRLKNQLLEKLPELQSQAKRLKSREARERWGIIKYIVKSQATVRKACLKQDRTSEWFRKWGGKLLKTADVGSLESGSRRPKKSPNKLKRLWEDRILLARQSRPFEGCERIAQRLNEVYRRQLSSGVVNKVLLRNGKISKKKAAKLTKKHLKRYRQPLPGYLQMDFKYVPYLIDGKQFYQLSCVDHHSTWRLIRIYDNKGFGALESFLIDLEHECPFEIVEIQTDNDLAFTHKFWKLRMGFDPTFEHPLAEWCEERDIRHKLIPVGQKELNGKVENTHKQDDREFYSQSFPQNLSHLQVLSVVYEERWNSIRKTKALGWKTPYEAIYEAYVRVLAWWGYLGLLRPITVLKIPKTKQLRASRKVRKPKRKSATDRYLKWIKEDAKKYGTND